MTNVNGQPDEIYTLAVSAIDKAGNESELSYRFALNRHGSVYDLSQISSLVDKAYIRYEDLEDLHIQEMNVSKVDEFEVYVTRNGEMIQSEQSNSRPSSRDNNTIYVGTRVNGSKKSDMSMITHCTESLSGRRVSITSCSIPEMLPEMK